MRARLELTPAGFGGADRSARRSAVWSVYLRTLYGPPRGATIGGMRLGELPDVEALGSISRSQLVARPHVLRRAIAPLVVARPADYDGWGAELRELILAAVPSAERDDPATFAHAVKWLRGWGRRRFAVEPAGAAPRHIRDALRLLDPEELLEAYPSYMSSEDGVFSVSRRARVRAPFSAIREALDPANWMSMGEFFEYVGPVRDAELVDRKDGWSGRFEERFVIGWGPFRLNSCNPFLRVDYTFDDSRVRADYGLLYEKDDQLEVDDGYLEAKTIPGRPGWADYHAEKRTKFRSPMTNLLSPAVMAVFLESSLSSIEDAAYDALARRSAAEGA